MHNKLSFPKFLQAFIFNIADLSVTSHYHLGLYYFVTLFLCPCFNVILGRIFFPFHFVLFLKIMGEMIIFNLA